MLSNIIEIFELATIVLLFLCVLRVYNNENKKDKEVPMRINPFYKKKESKEQKEEERKLQQVWDNLANYTGDSENQKEVK